MSLPRGFVTAWLRLFSLQASYNYERMQGLGAGVAAEPMLRDLPGGPDGERYRSAVARAAAYFNAHPYFAGLAVGAAARAEHQAASPGEVERLRTALCGPLGSMGDRLIWAGWLPVVAGGALAAAALGAGWAAIAVFLVAYNAVHLAVRWWALAAGWREGLRVVTALRNPALQHGLRIVRGLAPFAVGFALPLVATALTGFAGAETRVWVAGAALAAFGIARARLLPLSSLGVGLIAIAAALLAEGAGGLWR